MHAARWVGARWGDFGLMWQCLLSLAHVMGGLPWRCAGRRCLEVGLWDRCVACVAGLCGHAEATLFPQGLLLPGANVVNARVGEDFVGLP